MLNNVYNNFLNFFQERRLAGLREMVRTLRVGGRGLVYVWAMEQSRGGRRSAYLRQNKSKEVGEERKDKSKEVGEEGKDKSKEVGEEATGNGWCYFLKEFCLKLSCSNFSKLFYELVYLNFFLIITCRRENII